MWSKKEKSSVTVEQLVEPWGLRWRSSVWFTTIVVGYGLTVDLLVYSIIIPVVPFQLEKLGYDSVSALSGWLLFAFSIGLVISTPPIAWLSERYNVRRFPLLLGLFCLIGSSIMFMFAPTYWVMVFARVLEGISSSLVWVVGLALLCDVTPEERIGQQLGLALSSITIGYVIGPPIGGALYGRYGFKAPFIFGIIVTVVDAVGRILLIERCDALKYGFDPSAQLKREEGIEETVRDAGISTSQVEIQAGRTSRQSYHDIETPAAGEEHIQNSESTENSPDTPVTDATALEQTPKRALTPVGVIIAMSTSARTVAPVCIIFIYGMVMTVIEPTAPLRLQSVWDLDSSKVGLVFVAVAVPSIFSSPITGWIADHHGTRWPSVVCPILALPWWICLAIRWKLGLFISSLALATLFTTGVISPVTAELAAVSRGIPGIGYAHVYGAFNLSYGVGSSIGPLVSGQIYDHVARGWTVICGLLGGFSLISAGIAAIYIGESWRRSVSI